MKEEIERAVKGLAEENLGVFASWRGTQIHTKISRQDTKRNEQQEKRWWNLTEIGIFFEKMKPIDQVEAEALALGEAERAELAERLVESLAIPQNPAAQTAWAQLAKRRRDEIRSGVVAGIPGDEGSAMVRKLVGR